MGHVAERLYILHNGRFAPQTGGLWKRGFGAGDRSFALQGIHKRGLLTADIAASACVQVEL